MNFLNVVLRGEGEDVWVDGYSFKLKVPREKLAQYKISMSTWIRKSSLVSGPRTSTTRIC